MSAAKVKMKKIKSLWLDIKSNPDNSVVYQVVRPSGITLSVVSGRLEKEETDVIVNSIPSSLDVECGILSSAVSTKAGPNMQIALKENQGSVQYGDVFRTVGFKLKAKAVYHVVLRAFNYEHAGDILENLMKRCFDLAHHDKWTSISIPALGTGRHAFPPFVIPNRILEAIRHYEEKYKGKLQIRKIRFVMTENRNIVAFQEALAEVPVPTLRQVNDKVKGGGKGSFMKKKSPSFKKMSLDEELDMAGYPQYSGSSERQSSLDLDDANVSLPRGAVKKPSSLNLPKPDKLLKALQKSKAYKKEQSISRLRSHYRELSQPVWAMPWRHVITTMKDTTTHDDLDELIDTLVGPETYRKRKLILLHGQSYVGKSTLIQRITRRWADGELNHIRLLILVNLQTLLSLSQTDKPHSLRDCVYHCLSSAGISEEAAVEVLAPSRGKFLLLLDDVEACVSHFSSELPCNSFFSKAHIIATSRTSSAARLADAYSPALTIELLGFCPVLLEQFLSSKKGEISSVFKVKDAAKKLAQFSKLEKNKSMLHSPGWVELALAVLSHPKGAESDVESLLRFGPLMKEYIAQNSKQYEALLTDEAAKIGEHALWILSHGQESKPHKIPHLEKKFNTRWILDFCIAAHIKHEFERRGVVRYLSAASLEHIYQIQTSLEIACGFNTATSHYIHRMIAQISGDDRIVCKARQHVLDENDQVSARVLKRLHDLQARCLRQSNSRLVEGTDVPDELQYLGPEYSRVYLMACEQGVKKVHHTRVMIVGHFGAGKTSLKRCLVKEGFTSEYNITNGIDADLAACRIQVDSTYNWNLIEKAMETANTDEHSREVARLLFEFLKRMKTAQLPVVEEEEAAQTPEWDHTNVDFANVIFQDAQSEEIDEIDGPTPRLTVKEQLDIDSLKSASSTPSSNDLVSGSQHGRLEHSTSMNMLMEAMDKAGVSDADDVVNSLPQAVIESLKNMIQHDGDEPDSDQNEVKLSFWDFAGQQVFYTTHQTFLSHRAIYILVLDLTKDLDYIIESLRQSRHGKVVDRACPQTVGEYLDYWLNCIHTHAVKDSSQNCTAQPPVLIVCTHRDVLEQKYGKEEADQMVKNYFRAIQKQIDKKAYAEHVHSTFFAVANCEEGDADISNLRRAIVTTATSQPYWGEKVPLKWLHLRNKLQELEVIDGSVASLKKVRELASDAGIVNTDEVKTLLLFYHALGELVFFDEEGLRDFIVLNPQWLIDNFRKVITVSKFHKQHVFPNSRQHWSNLDDYGFLHNQILNSVWHSNTKEELVAIMKKFNLIVPVGQDYQPDEHFNVPEINGNHSESLWYLVPCMLPQVAEDDLPERSDHYPHPLLLIFQTGFVPVGVFHRLLATCSNQLEWSIFGTIYHDFASFFVDDSEEVVISLRAFRNCIEISAQLMENEVVPPSGECPYSHILHDCLNSVKSQLYSVIRTVSPTQRFFIGIRCNCKVAPIQGALINLEKVKPENLKKKIKCTTHRGAFVARGLEPWFIPTAPPLIKVEEPGCLDSFPPPQDLMKTAIPTEEQLAILSSHIGFSWEKLALLLHINSARIQQIKMDNPSSSEMCILRMLILWRREALSMQEHDRVETLTQALIKCELRNLAEKVARWKVEGQPLVLDD